MIKMESVFLIKVILFILKVLVIPYDSEKIHGISTELGKKIGVEINFVLDKFHEDLKKSKFICGHNLNFDEKILGSEYLRSMVN